MEKIEIVMVARKPGLCLHAGERKRGGKGLDEKKLRVM
jgi:hypothetical protein